MVLYHSIGRCILWCVAFALLLLPLHPARAQDAPPPALGALLQVLQDAEDPQFQLDILRGISAALKGRRSVPMPDGWPAVEQKLANSQNPEIKSLVQSLALTFGSDQALANLRQTLQDTQAPQNQRRNALDALLETHDPQLPSILHTLLRNLPVELRAAALRALAAYSHSQTASAILDVYPQLSAPEKRDALNTLASRKSHAQSLAQALRNGTVPGEDLTADLVRQLRSLGDEEVNAVLQDVWGIARASAPDKQQEIQRYKQIYRAGGSQPGDPARGRVVYARVCQQCHVLFDIGGKVGPDLTGSNRADLDYILENMVDPNAVIPNDYRSSTIDTKDDRVLTGIIKNQGASVVTVETANDTILLPADQIASIQQSELSMMPEGLLEQLTDQEVRDLIYYLRSPTQVPLPATAETVPYFFNGQDLSNWEGDPSLWRVEDGQIIGQTRTGLRRNDFLVSQMLVGDFRLLCEVKLVPNTANSGIQFRSQMEPQNSVKGYQADIGAGWWGKLYEEHGRALLWDKPGDPFVRQEEWNTYEILAVGDRIQTAINGNLCVDLKDPDGARYGIIAFQLHSGGPTEVRFRNLKLEADPQPKLKTVP